MPLHHFTSIRHLPGIINTGAILPTESNIGAPWPTKGGHPSGKNAGPDVVHLLDIPNPDTFGHGLGGSSTGKTQVRFTITGTAIPWGSWSWVEEMDPKWRAALEESAGPGASEHWLVVPASIRAKRWAALSLRHLPDSPIPEHYLPYLGEPDEHGYMEADGELLLRIIQG